MTHSVEQIAYKAHIRQIRERLNAIEEMRDAKRLSLAGKSPREIAEILNTTQPRVHRMLRGSGPLDESQTPEELILRAALNGTPREKLIRDLGTMDYTFSKCAPPPHEGSIPGTWTQVGAAHVRGLLTDEEYEEICGFVRPPSS
ncbi:helix-turn-helix domain-containing protein [Mycolicibacterium llatzerense]|uniref:helix-turn-helix domain-containing protein n=1 Tax=Mycolicibacterium llatzerense TaxID=280871 RepID=UPI0021B54934|nr:helix-turn-helix domain-containing protein [Mycolicibacterium llatzerense]